MVVMVQLLVLKERPGTTGLGRNCCPRNGMGAWGVPLCRL